MFQSPQRPAVRALRFKRNPFQSSDESAGLDDQERSGLVRRVATGRSLVVVDEVVEPSSGESDGAAATSSSYLNRLADDDSDSDDDDDNHGVHPFIGVKTVVDAAPSLSGSASATSLSTFTTTTEAVQTSGSAASKSSQSPSSSSPSQTASSTPPAVSTPDTSSSSTPIPSGTGTVEAANNSNGTSGAESKGHSGLSGGAVAAIVIVLLLLLAAAGFFLLRKHFKGRRRLPRAFWKAGVPATPDDFSAIEKGTTSYSTEHGAIDPFPLSVAPPVNPPAPQTASAALRTVQRIPPPSADPFSDAHSIAGSDAPGEKQQRPVLAVMPVPAMAHVKKTPSPVATTLSVPPTPRSLILPRSPARTTPLTTHFDAPPVPAGAPALVRVIFIPTMPDELAIEVDEVLRVLSAYDDGWALCANARGAQGMVPLECLEGGGGHFGMGPNTEGMAGPARLSRRASSLYAAKRTSATSARSRVR